MNARPCAALRAPQARRIKRLEARILELSRTLQLVEEARAGLADQYDFAPIGFVTLDTRGCVREINLTAVRMLERERSQLLGMPFFTQIATPHCQAFLNHLRECRNRHAEVITDAALRAGKGGAVPVELRSVPVLDPRRGDTVYRTAITDITLRLQAGKALRESEERYRVLVEFSPDGIFVQSNGAIVFANSAALRLCGVEDAEELLGGEILDWVGPPFRRAVKTALLAPAAQETPTIEARLSRRDGAAVEVEMAAHAFRYEGGPAVLVVARDITRRRTAERDVLEISERERTGFGRDIHDSLCQELLGAAYLAEVLRNRTRETDPLAASDADDLAGIVRNCAEEARCLAHGLYPVALEHDGLVAALHSLTAGVSGRARVRCALECDDDLAVPDPGVATNLYRIAQEAVSNAVKHGKAKAILIRLAAGDGKLTLTVRDDGNGIPAKPKQTGMGLHTMLYRAAMIGGSLDVRPDRPRGTVVTCSFPTRRDT